jgi:Arc/MetJ-type ribon-helix-helix transcriptional regulator
MATKPTPVSAPLTFDLPLELLTKIGTLQKKSGLGSTSEVVRQALREFDFGSYQSAEPERRQISVRLPPEVRRFLLKTAKKKKVSLGELLRAAIEALSAGRRKG